MKTEKVATIKCLIKKNAKETYYVMRSFLVEGETFWFYTFENDKQIKTFAVEPTEPNVYCAEKTTEVEKYLEEFKNRMFPTPCLITYEVEYLNVNDLNREIGFKPLNKWYEEFLKCVDKQILELLSEDFPKGFWRAYEKFYRENEDFRKLLSIERYRLSNHFSSVLGYVIKDESFSNVLEELYGNEFVDWLYQVASKLL